MKPRVISQSTTEPIELAEAVGHLRAAGSPEALAGGRISRLIKVARQACEEYLEESLIEKVLEIACWSLDQCGIELPWGPVRSVVSVTYVNTAGADTVLAADQYRISPYASPTVLVPAYDVTWPDVRGDLDSVRIRYAVGYPSADSPPEEVPEPIRQAMHLYIAHYYAHREAVGDDTLMELPLGARHLLSTYRTGLGV
jgi:uncharacterized phiE125 gp8 family phage protein